MSGHLFILFDGINGDSSYYHYGFTISDPYNNERRKKYDHLLYETLSKIFGGRSLTSDQIKKRLRASNNGRDSISTLNELISRRVEKREPALGQLFLRSGKLSTLWIAVLNSFHRSAELLVSLCADIAADLNECQAMFAHSQWSMLHVLVKMYPSEWNERLIALVAEHGADLEARDIEGKTPLHYALNYKRVQAAKLLLERGADANTLDDIRGSTYLLIKAASTHYAGKFLPLLVKYGADVTVRDTNGKNALHSLVECPLEKRLVVDLARLLIEKGTSLDDRTKLCQYQPLHWALFRKEHELVELFLKCGADVNARADGGQFPLNIAAEGQNTELLKTLLKHGANIDMRMDSGSTVMHTVCRGFREGIEILLRVGADISIEDHNGNTPGSLLTISEPTCKMLAIENARRPPSMAWKLQEVVYRHGQPLMLQYFNECNAEIETTKSASFFKSCTMFDVLTKCQCQIVNLMRNIEFEKKLFNEFNLDKFLYFPIYSADIRIAFERAQLYYQSMLDQEKLLNDACYDTLPDAVARTVTGFIECEVCEMKRIVQASRHR